jgi:hypothetical protein
MHAVHGAMVLHGFPSPVPATVPLSPLASGEGKGKGRGRDSYACYAWYHGTAWFPD